MGGRGRTNRDYFQWLYTGLTRAKNEIYIVNFQELHPLMDIKFEDTKPIPTSEQEPLLSQKSLSYELLIAPIEFRILHHKDGISDDVINNTYTIIRWLSERGIEATPDFRVSFAVKLAGKNCKGVNENIIFSYNRKGIPGKPRVENGTEELKGALNLWITPNIIVAERFPEKLKPIYLEWETQLKELGFAWKQFEAVGYNDRIWLVKDKEFIVIDAFHNEEGFITYIAPFKTNNPSLWSEVKQAISLTMPSSLKQVAS